MSWSSRRKFIYSLYIVIPVLIVLGVIVAPHLKKPEPTCFDGILNGLETGVDCGGACARVCVAETVPPVVLWSRAFPVQGDKFHAFGYVENRNTGAIAYDVPYVFELRDHRDRLIAKSEGRTFLPPNGVTAVFAPWIEGSRNREIFRTVLSFGYADWMQIDRDAYAQIPFTILERELLRHNTAPKLAATVRNDALFPMGDFDVFAVLYDEEDNAVSVGKTYIDRIEGGKTQDIFFTWPLPFTEMPARIEIIPKIDPATYRVQ